MNKKGEEKYFSVWWFLVLLLVGGSVAYATSAFLSIDKDIRFLEAGTLYTQVENCIVQDTILDTSIFDEGYNIYGDCGLSKRIINSSFYIGVFLMKNDETLNKTYFGKDYSTQCEIVLSKTIAEKYPKCISIEEEIFFIEGGLKKIGTLKIIVGSDNHGNKISLQ